MIKGTCYKICRIEYDDQDGEAISLEKLNRRLDGLKLKKLVLENFDGHVERKFTLGGQNCCYVPEYGTLIGTLSKDGYVYRIDAVVEASGDHDLVADRWREAHPDRPCAR